MFILICSRFFCGVVVHMCVCISGKVTHFLPAAFGHVLVIGGRFELGVEADHFGDKGVALLLDLLARAILARVQPLALAVVNGLRRGTPAGRDGGDNRANGQPFFSSPPLNSERADFAIR